MSLTVQVIDDEGEVVTLPAREVECATPTCADLGVVKVIPDNGNPVMCGACGQWIIQPS